MIKRKPLSALIGQTIHSIARAPVEYIQLCDKEGKLIALVNCDDLYDEHGNRLEDDLP